MADLLGNSDSVTGDTKPNATVKAITDSSNLKAEKLTKKYIVILSSGTRDIAKNKANTSLSIISQFANSVVGTNMIIMCAPTHFDLQSASCVNKEVALFNRKLQKTMKIHKHVQVCSMSTNCDHYTTHGFHMNARGKHWITNTWASIIKTLNASSSSTPIIPLPGKNKSLENLVSPTNSSSDYNTMICVPHEEASVFQSANLNIVTSNEPLICNPRAPRQKNPLNRNDDFYGIRK